MEKDNLIGAHCVDTHSTYNSYSNIEKQVSVMCSVHSSSQQDRLIISCRFHALTLDNDYAWIDYVNITRHLQENQTSPP